MAIILNDNIKINAGKPSESKYLTSGNTAYASITAVNAAIPISERYVGLTVLIDSGTTNIEHWYEEGVTNGDLIEKKFNTIIPIGDFITGATNLGYFSGQTGIQTLPITNLPDTDYNGNYNSLYNFYYRGIDGNIHADTPTDEIPRRGYVKTAIPVKSFLWNEYTGSTNLLGWILVDGDISTQLGTFQNGVIYYTGASEVYTETGWTTGIGYNNGSDLVISTVVGSLTTGTTLAIGGRPFDFSEHNNLHFRTIVSETPQLIGVRDDETFIYLSGNTGSQIITASNGLTKVGQNVKLGGTLTASTVITDSNAIPSGITYAADYSATFISRSLIDKGYVDGRLLCSLGGERIFKMICQTSHGFNTNCVVGWSGGTYNLAIANGTYDGEILGVISKCFNANCFELTQAGYVTGLTPTLTMNCTYFLSATVAGKLCEIEPIVPNFLSKSMLIATSSNTGWVLPYAAYVISSGFTDGGALVKNVCLPTIPTYSMINSDFFVGVSGGSTVVLPTTPKCGMVVVVGDVGNNAASFPITIVGSVVGCTSTSQIDTNSGSLSYIYNGTRWNVFAFSPVLS